MADIRQYTTAQSLANTSEFEQVCSIIDRHTACTLSLINQEHLATCWEIGAYISQRLKEGKWGDKIVRELANYIRLHRPNNRDTAEPTSTIWCVSTRLIQIRLSRICSHAIRISCQLSNQRLDNPPNLSSQRLDKCRTSCHW